MFSSKLIIGIFKVNKSIGGFVSSRNFDILTDRNIYDYMKVTSKLDIEYRL